MNNFQEQVIKKRYLFVIVLYFAVKLIFFDKIILNNIKF